MIRFLIRALIYVLANAVGLLLAVIILPGFRIDVTAFIAAVALFSVIEVVAGPLITRLSLRNAPNLAGGVALITTFIGLWVCELFLAGMQIGGIANHLAATLLVWLGAIIAGMILPMFVFKHYMQEHSQH